MVRLKWLHMGKLESITNLQLNIICLERMTINTVIMYVRRCQVMYDRIFGAGHRVAGLWQSLLGTSLVPSPPYTGLIGTWHRENRRALGLEASDSSTASKLHDEVFDNHNVIACLMVARIDAIMHAWQADAHRELRKEMTKLSSITFIPTNGVPPSATPAGNLVTTKPPNHPSYTDNAFPYHIISVPVELSAIQYGRESTLTFKYSAHRPRPSRTCA